MRKQVQFLGALLLFSLIVSTTLIWYCERPYNETITTLGDIVWWWIVTSTTVGYGDISPRTGLGRMAGVLAILTGIYCYTVCISLVHEWVQQYLNRDRLGSAKVSATNHIVICEYTAFADELIQALADNTDWADRDVAVITDLIGVRPYRHVRFVRGVPISPASLEQANIAEAAYIFVFSNVRFKDPDLKTLHVVSRIQKLNEKAQVFVELENPDTNFRKLLRREITAMVTRDLLESVIREEGLDLSRYLPSQPRTS